MGAYLKACLMWADRYPDKKTNEYVLINGTSDDTPGLFFFVTPEKIAESAKAHRLEIIENAGVDFTFNDNLINGMSDEKFEAWLELADSMVESESCAGLANHSLLICRK